MLETILFYLIAGVAVISAISVVTARSAVYSVLSLVLTMSMIAGFFILLKAFLVATILILVYAGAILVLFLFVVMHMDFKSITAQVKGFGLSPFIAGGIAIVLFLQIFSIIRTVPVSGFSKVQGTSKAIGELLFHRYLLPFELTSFLILAAVVSIVVLAKKDTQ